MPQKSPSGAPLAAAVAVPFDARITEDEPGVVTVAVSGELDLATSPELRAKVREVLTARPWRLTIDLTAVTFCGSSGLRTLLALTTAAGEAGTRLKLRPTAAIARLLAITCLDSVLPLTEPAAKNTRN
ncbi:STAS domain-containing protein [Amycolatopsis sp. NPDC004169]|uniref:STAS domain-containing protein n=1 Tax=Amycolatopsis sp. NPDC004169 TaxID=3154453 RepID=UPI0033ADCB8A